MAAIIHRVNMKRVKIETCNKNQTPLSLGQLQHAVGHPGWKLLPKFTKVTAIIHRVGMKTCSKSQTPLRFGHQSEFFHSLIFHILNLNDFMH